MKLPVKLTWRHRGKALDIDSETETMTVLGRAGEKLGTLSWEAVIDYIQGYVEEARPTRLRNHPRSRLSVKVRALASDSRRVESLTGEIGGGGVFIESGTPFPPGTELTLELVLPDHLPIPIQAKGIVTWVRPRPERYVFFPGMGVQFTEISEKGRERLLEMVKSLNHIRRGT